MRRLFGAKKAAPPAPSIEETTTNLNARGDSLNEKIKKLDAEMARYRDQLKKTRPGPAQAAIKQRAMRVLKQKRMYEQQQDQLYQQSFNMEQLNFTQEQLKTTKDTVSAMKSASAQLKKEFKSVDIDEIEKMQDEMQDMLDLSNEINETMSQSFAVPDDIDEEELMGELDALEDEWANEDAADDEVPSYLQDVPDIPSEQLGDLPAAPTGADVEAEPAEAERIKS